MIALYRGVSLISRAIRWQTRSMYSHAAWVMPDWSCIEAWHKGGVKRNDTPFTVHTPDTPIDLFSVNATVAQLDEIEAFLLSQVGKGYDFGAVARFVSRRNADNASKWFCSELVFAAFQRAGVQLLKRVEPWQVSPGLLAMSPLLIYQRTTSGQDLA